MYKMGHYFLDIQYGIKSHLDSEFDHVHQGLVPVQPQVVVRYGLGLEMHILDKGMYAVMCNVLNVHWLKYSHGRN